jgi:N-acetylmuramoyl-L-alanine amidase
MKKCALVIGHKKSSQGASNRASGLTEFIFNDKLAIDLEEEISGVEVQRIYRRTYNSLPGDINELNPDFIISLHCNAFDGSASGTEVLYYHKSTKGKLIAGILNEQLVEALGLKNRGLKPKTAEDRGGYLLKNTVAPCVIAEPFFIDNNDDLKTANDKRDIIVKAYAKGVEAIAKSI